MPDASRFHDHLADLTLLALVVAHGADADLDPRETDAIARRLHALDPDLSGDELIVLVGEALDDYLTVRVQGIDEIVERLGVALDAAERARALRALAAVAEADGVVHRMEHTLLRHLAEAWDLGPDALTDVAEPSA